jgi:energy-coupling factor transporter ATP-binding protein EcfA2
MFKNIFRRIRGGTRPGTVPDPDRVEVPRAMESPLERYLTYVKNKTEYLSLKGLLHGHIPRVWLKDVYVALKATSGDLGENASGSHAPLIGPTDNGGRAGRTVLLDTSFYKRTDGNAARLDIEEALRDNRQIVVLGEPGSGKSTFVKYICSQVVRKPELYREMLGIAGRPIPLLIQMAGLNPQALHDVYDLASSALPDALRRVVPPEVIVSELNAGCCVIVLDGLDEIADLDQRRQVSRRIDELAASIPAGNRLIVASRIAGYRDAPLGSSFSRFTLCDFDSQDVRAFIKRWYEAVVMEGTDPRLRVHEVGDRVQRLLDVLDRQPQIRQLARNPLLLTIILLVYSERLQLPKDRAELYHQCIDVLLEHLQQAKADDAGAVYHGDTADYLRLDQRREVLKGTARWMHQNGLTQGPKDELAETVLYRILENMGKGRELALPLLSRIESGSGLLITKSQDIGFPHLAFQEYLTALSLIELSETSEVTSFLCDLRYRSWWREVICIYSALAADSSVLVSGLLECPDTPLLHSLLLTGACVAEARVVDPALRAAVVERLMDVYAAPPVPFLRTFARDVLVAIGGRPVQLLCYAALELKEREVSWYLDAIELLARVADSTTGEVLLRWSFDDSLSESVRLAAIRGIRVGRFLSPEGEARLVELAWSVESSALRCEALATLGLLSVGQSTLESALALLRGVKEVHTFDEIYVAAFKAFAPNLEVDEAFGLCRYCLGLAKLAEYKPELCRATLQIRCEESQKIEFLLDILYRGIDWGARGGAALVLAMSISRREEIAHKLTDRLINDRELGMRIRIADALGYLGWKDPEVLSSLMAVVNDESHSQTRWKIIEAFASLTQDSMFIKAMIVTALMSDRGIEVDEQVSALDILDRIQYHDVTLTRYLVTRINQMPTKVAHKAIIYLARHSALQGEGLRQLHEALTPLASDANDDLILRDRAAEALYYLDMSPREA